MSRVKTSKDKKRNLGIILYLFIYLYFVIIMLYLHASPIIPSFKQPLCISRSNTFRGLS